MIQDPLSPVLYSSPALVVTEEQKAYVREILDIACSDSKFAEKAYLAISKVLTNGSVATPVTSSLTPSTVVIGAPSFTLHVIGTGFTPVSVIIFNGFDEPTTYVSPTEVTTGVNMGVWAAPVVVPVAVRNEGGIVSNPTNFSFTAT